MIELIILGIVLFIVGVGATFIYDKHKEQKVNNPLQESWGGYMSVDRIAAYAKNLDVIKKITKPKNKPKRKSKSTQHIEEEFLAKFKAHTDSIKSKPKPKVKKTIKPGSIKVGKVNASQVPEETQYLEELFEDVSTQSTLTVQELIDKIEKMKKKS